MRSGFIGHKWQDASQMRLGTMPLLCKFLVRKGRFVWTGPNIIIATVVTSHDQAISAFTNAKIIFSTRIIVNIVHHHQHASHIAVIMSCALCFPS
jgi:hypothetical protein